MINQSEKAKKVKNLLDNMTLEEKIGQCIVVGMSGSTVTADVVEAVEKYHCGGIRLSPFVRLFRYFSDSRIKDSHDSAPRSRDKHRILGPAPWVSPAFYAGQLAQLRKLSLEHGAGIPVHFVLDQEGDTSKDLSRGGIAQFPSAMGLAASNDPDLTYRVSRAVAAQIRESGIHVIHSPVLDVNLNPQNPEIGRRSFGDDPETVALHGAAVMRGFRDEGVLAVAKHFPGRGDSAVDAHFSCPVLDVSRERLNDVDLYPYKQLISQGLQAIMIAHCIYPALDDKIATVSRRIVTDLLREEMGFSGLITTDSITMGALIDAYGVGEASARALAAGADFVLMKAENRWRGEVFQTVRKAVEEERISEKELDEKVERILSWKEDTGLLDNPELNPDKAGSSYETPEIRSLEREAALKSALILKGKDVLPLDTRKKTAVIYQENSVKTPNDSWDYPSLFGDLMEQAGHNFHTFEIPFAGDDMKDAALNFIDAGDFEQIIITNFYDRSAKPGTLAAALVQRKIPVILITNTPYTVKSSGGLIPEADAVLVNMNLTPEGLRVSRDILLGRAKPEGTWPLKHYYPEG